MRISCDRDHPRIRGEHIDSVNANVNEKGSSPHTRGARCGRVLVRLLGGIIPAYAGSTGLRQSRLRFRRDHPRIRGEHVLVADALPSELGSSPHTRGAQERWDKLSEWVGIIPAYAGSTTASLTTAITCRDHPRIRGEHQHQSQSVYVGVGSSPHTRGAHDHGDGLEGIRGIIPAYAGSTLC